MATGTDIALVVLISGGISVLTSFFFSVMNERARRRDAREYDEWREQNHKKDEEKIAKLKGGDDA